MAWTKQEQRKYPGLYQLWLDSEAREAERRRAEMPVPAKTKEED